MALERLTQQTTTFESVAGIHYAEQARYRGITAGFDLSPI